MQAQKHTTDEIMNSLQGMQPAPAPAFFYSKLLGRMEKEKGEKSGMYRNPATAWAFAALLVFLTINVTVLLKQKSPATAAPSGMESFADAYHLNASPSY